VDEPGVGVGAIPQIEGEAPQAEIINDSIAKDTKARCMIFELYPLRLRVYELM
jgi:hypothetical protein